MRFPIFTRPSRAAGGCPSCGNPVEPDQLACIECGALLGRDRRLAAAAWRAPVVVVTSVLLLLATGFGFASGAVSEDGEVTVAEVAPPAPPANVPPANGGGDLPEASGEGSELPALPKPGEAGGGDELALDPKDLDLGGSGSGSGSREDERESGSGGSGLSGGGGSSGDRERPNRQRSSSPSPARDSRPPEPKVSLATWPNGRTGFAVVLKSSRSRQEAQAEARSAASDGLRAGVVASSEFSNQPSGRFIAFAGQPFSSRDDAERFLGNTVEPEGYTATVLFLDGSAASRTP